MKAYETSATVEDRGQVRVAGVPFEPGTQVDVIITPIISPVENGARSAGSDGAERAAPLLAALDKARNHQSICTFKRVELYHRDER